jgi:hypothetical protein
MKTLLLLLSLYLIATNVSAQDPDLFDQTWYLRDVFDTDEGEYIIVVEGYQPYGGNPSIPQINPHVTISPSLSFSGLGICNTFNGALEYDSQLNSFRTITTNQSTMSCGFYEDMVEPATIGPFGYVDPDPTSFTIINPQITDDPDGFQTFTYGTQPFIAYRYRNTPVLGTEDLRVGEIKVFPNPSESIVNIMAHSLLIESIHLLDANGRIITTKEPPSNNFSINISSLESGIYFLEINSSEGRFVRKLLRM